MIEYLVQSVGACWRLGDKRWKTSDIPRQTAHAAHTLRRFWQRWARREGVIVSPVRAKLTEDFATGERFLVSRVRFIEGVDAALKERMQQALAVRYPPEGL